MTLTGFAVTGTLLAGPLNEWRHGRSERKWMQREERRQAAIALLDTYAAWWTYINHAFLNEIIPESEPATSDHLRGVPLLEAVNSALHRAQLMFQNAAVREDLARLDKWLSEWRWSLFDDEQQEPDYEEPIDDLPELLRRELEL